MTPNAISQTSGSQITVIITSASTYLQSGDAVTVPSGMLAVSNIVVNSATSISAMFPDSFGYPGVTIR